MTSQPHRLSIIGRFFQNILHLIFLALIMQGIDSYLAATRRWMYKDEQFLWWVVGAMAYILLYNIGRLRFPDKWFFRR